MLDQEYLMSILDYCYDSGLFRWKIRPAKHINIGDVAGSKDKDGYVIIMISGKNYRAHRLAWLYMTGKHPKNLIDHKDRIKHHNWFSNLRESDHTHNQENIGGARINNKSGSNIAGVSFNMKQQKWVVKFRIDHKDAYFGTYVNQVDAEEVCLMMRRKYLLGNLL